MSTAPAPPTGPGPVADESRGTLGSPRGSMGPKVEAAALFARNSGKTAVIGSLEQLSSILAGHGGTRISVQAEGMETR